jgi:hypothetical protein
MTICNCHHRDEHLRPCKKHRGENGISLSLMREKALRSKDGARDGNVKTIKKTTYKLGFGKQF